MARTMQTANKKPKEIVISSDSEDDNEIEQDDTFDAGSEQLVDKNPNKLTAVSYRPLVDLLSRLTKTDTSSSRSSSVEIVSIGKRRARDSASPLPVTKRSRLDSADSAPSLHLHSFKLSYVLPPAITESELEHKKKIIKYLSKRSEDEELQGEVVLVAKKGQIEVLTPEEPNKHWSLESLLKFNSLGEQDELAKSWAKTERKTWVFRNGRRVQVPEVVYLPKTGEGSLLDACIYLANQATSSSFTLTTTLSVTLSPLSVHLTSNIHIKPSFYKTLSYNYFILPKVLFLTHLFPQKSVDGASEWKGDEEASVDYFFKCLRRAPRTFEGVRIVKAKKVVGGNEEDSDDEEARRRRRMSKGKGKARDQIRAAEIGTGLGVGEEEDENMEYADVEEEGEEDELIHPPGLKSTLHPFQSRTVRWMLSREGKYVLPMSTSSPTFPDPEIKDLPSSLLKDVRRGPLWEKAELDLPEGEGKKSFWLNRIQGTLREDDPADEVEVEEEDIVMKDADGEEEEEKKVNFVGAARIGQGGFVSEEMGLGKTVEVLSLILLHRQPERNLLPTYYDPGLDSDVQPTSLTLVISPSAIVAQWASEVKKHAPGLRVLRYESIKSVKEAWTPLYLAENFDIILTTFDVLRREVVFARKPHERALRSGRSIKPKYRRSMLVQIEFLRVVMDEVQQVGDLVSATSETASLIPRKFSFAVSGTPIKSKIEDLQAILRFLKVEPIGSNKSSMNRLLGEEVPTFVRIVKQLGARTIKSQVEHELVLPRQNRFVVPVDFGAVEKYWYEERYLEALEQLGLESDGTIKAEAFDENGDAIWDMDQSDLNRWLVILRQLCCHPQVGQNNKRVLGNALKTVDEVLLNLKDGAVAGVHAEQRQLWFQRVRRAQLQMWDKEDCERFEDALEVFLSAIKELQPMVNEILGSLRDAWTERKAERRRRGRSSSASADAEENEDGLGAALGYGLEDEEKSAGNDIPLSEKERQIATRISALRSRLREVLLVQHSAHFFTGSAYFNLGKFDEEERAAYANAEDLRQTLLTPLEVRVDAARVKLRGQLEERDAVEQLQLKLMEFPFSKHGGGLVAQQTFDDIDSTIDSLNGQAELIWIWREEILNMMLNGRISISGEDATGDEYAERAELQEKLDLMIEAYGALLDDYRYGLTGEHSALADANLEAYGYDKNPIMLEGKRKREKKHEKKKKIDLQHRAPPSLERGDAPGEILRYELLLRRAEVQGERKLPEKPEKPPSPEHDKGKKKKKKQVDSDDEDVEEAADDDPNVIPIRGLIKRLHDATENFALPEQEEELIVMEQKRLRKTSAPLEKRLDRLRAELGEITKAFNARLTYFAQLQIISDEVADPDFTDKKWKGLTQEMQACEEEASALEKSILKKLSQRRYLESLHIKDAGDEDEDDSVCVICSDTYTQGVVTTCAHCFCKACFNLWIHRNKSCPICKKELHRGDYEVVRYRRPMPGQVPRADGNLDDDEEMGSVEVEAPVRLRVIPDADLEEIRDVETVNPLSSKSDMIVKHVKFIRRNDPTAKIVIFSTWTEALDILMQAFTRNGVQYVRLEGAAGSKKESVVTKFIDDPNVAAFFLHTRSQSAGLNLIAAQYVFLVEPLFHASHELQAVGRTHRIGQEKETTVFQYYVAATVDERVALLRGRQKTSLFLNNSLVNSRKESLILQEDIQAGGGSPKKQAADELDDLDQLGQCLFQPDHFRNLQRSLLPPQLRKGEKKQVVRTASEMAGLAAASRAAASLGA